MKIIDTSNWNRKEHYEFFSTFENPFFGITTEIDLTFAYQFCKEHQYSFHHYYHFITTKTLNQIEALKYRIINEKVVLFDTIHTTTTLLKPDHTFIFTFVEHTSTFEAFTQLAKIEFDKAVNAKGLGLTDDTARPDTIHYSTNPWFKFSSIEHPKSSFPSQGNPKITFGKAEFQQEKMTMPISIHAHHGLVDGYHIGLFLDQLQINLNQPQH